jgi:hypothetical protein
MILRRWHLIFVDFVHKSPQFRVKPADIKLRSQLLLALHYRIYELLIDFSHILNEIFVLSRLLVEVERKRS